MLKTNWCCLTLVACLQTAIHAQNIDLGTLKGQINERVKAKPLEINGGISFNTVTTFGMQPNPQPFTYVASGNLIFKIKNYDLPFSFTYTNRKWNYQNPTFKFNYTSFQPKYKQWQAHLGDISMNLSPYTLAGFQMQGVGLSYTPQNGQMQVVGGRMMRAFAEDSAQNNKPSFYRFGTGAKMQYQQAQQKIGLVVFYAADDPYSIPLPQRNPTIRPMENSAFALTTGFAFTKKWRVETEFSTSVLTRNTLQPQERDDRNPPLTQLVKHHNASTSVYHAFKTDLNYEISQNDKIGLAYQRVDPDYYTLGGYFFTNDFENVTLNAQHRGKINAMLSTGLQRDDLKNRKERNAGRMVVSSNLSFKVNEKIDVSLNYSNFQSYAFIRTGFERVNRITPFDNLDTLNFTQLSQNAGLNLTIPVRQDSICVQNWSLNANFMTADNRKGTVSVAENGSNIISGAVNYTQSLLKQKKNIAVGFNYALNQTGKNQITTIGPTVSYAMPILDSIQLGTSIAYNTTFGALPKTDIFTLSVGANNSFKKVHNVNAQFLAQYRSTSGKPKKDFNVTLNVGYSYAFQQVTPDWKKIKALSWRREWAAIQLQWQARRDRKNAEKLRVNSKKIKSKYKKKHTK
jgi:hypothetical protein